MKDDVWAGNVGATLYICPYHPDVFWSDEKEYEQHMKESHS